MDETANRERESIAHLIIKRPIKALSSFVGGILTRLTTWVAEMIHATFIGRFMSVDVLRYAICGFSNYIILDAILYYIIYHYVVGAERYIYLGITTISPHIASLIIVFPITFLTGFWLNRHVAFASTKMGMRRQLMRYAISIIGSIILSYLLLKGLVEGVGIWPTPAKIIGSLITAIYSYLMARLYTFPKVK